MAARRKRPVLYELVARTERARSWTAPRPVPPPEVEAPPTTPAPLESRDEAPAPAGDAERNVIWLDGRLYLALGAGHLTLLAALLVVLLVVAFEVGQRNARPPTVPPPTQDVDSILGQSVDRDTTPSEVDPAPRAPVRPPAVPQRPREAQPAPQQTPAPRPAPTPAPQTSPQQMPQPTPAPTPARVTLEAGKYYVFVQYFPKSRRQAAEAARDFLRSKGVECVVHDQPDDLALIATRAFDSSEQAQLLIRSIREYGREYGPRGGYDFSGCLVRRM